MPRPTTCLLNVQTGLFLVATIAAFTSYSGTKPPALVKDTFS